MAASSPSPPAASRGGPGPRWKPEWTKKLKSFLLAQHLPIGLVIVIVFGFLVPAPGLALAKTPINTVSICGIFFLSGLQLQTHEIATALRAYTSIAFGMLSILLLTPLLAFALVRIPLGAPEYGLGLAMFAIMPTTISSGVLMTAEAQGNVALSLLFSVLTNLIAVATVPFWLSALVSDDAAAGGQALNPLDLLWKLTLSILLPLAVGKACRAWPPAVAFSTRWKLQLKLLSSLLLISVPYVNISQSADSLAAMTAADLALLVFIGMLMHAVFLLFNYVCVRLLRLPTAESKAVVINASQKTINTAMSVIQFLPPGFARLGLMMLPILISHFVQIIMDAFIVAYWRKATATDAAIPTAAAAGVPVALEGQHGLLAAHDKDVTVQLHALVEQDAVAGNGTEGRKSDAPQADGHEHAVATVSTLHDDEPFR